MGWVKQLTVLVGHQILNFITKEQFYLVSESHSLKSISSLALVYTQVYRKHAQIYLPRMIQSNLPWLYLLDLGTHWLLIQNHSARVTSCKEPGHRKLFMTITMNMAIKNVYQSPEDEEDHEEAPKGGFCINIPITDGGHGDHEQVDTFPIGESLVVLEVFPWIP